MTSHEHPTSAPPVGRGRQRQYRRWFEDVVSGGDLALADELLGPGYRLHVPGTPEPLDREAHGRIAEAWATYDVLGLMPQLGAVPASERPPHG